MWTPMWSSRVKPVWGKPGTFHHPLLKSKCLSYASGVQKYKILIWEKCIVNFALLLMFKLFLPSSPILDMIASFPLMSPNFHICFISFSRATHLFIFPVCVLGMYLLSEKTFSITSSAFMMLLSAFPFYYTSWPGPHQRSKGLSTYRIQ